MAKFKFQGPSAQRIDLALPALLEQHGLHGGVTRSQIKRWIGEGRLSVDGKKVSKAGFILEPGAEVCVDAEPSLREEFLSYDFKLDIIFEDEHLIVINKPAGLTMHPGAGNKSNTLVNALVAYCGKEFASRFDSRPGIAHRLDKDTSGVVVVAKSQEILSQLSKQFSSRSVKRSYVALLLSGPRRKGELDTKDQGRIETQLGRDPNNRFYFKVIPEGGKTAATNWVVRERFSHGLLVDLRLETGRTHQIRVQMNHLGAPVIGDKLYGDFTSLPSELLRASKEFGRQALHAKSLTFVHPKRAESLSFETDPPAEMVSLIEKFRNYR